MLARLRRVLDIRPGEGVPVALAFSYVAIVVASFLLAKPIRNGLFLGRHGPYALVYVYAAVPLVLSVFVPVYSRITERFGARAVTVGTLLVFSSNVLLFWFAFRYHPFDLLPGIFYVWVNCFGVIAPVQAWSFANSLFDTRQAKRLFGLIGSGASFGAITGGLLARFLVDPLGGAVNLMLVLACLILAAALIVAAARRRLQPAPTRHHGRARARPFRLVWREIVGSSYLRHIAGLVFAVAIATQWTAFQLSVVANARFGGDADALTEFFGTFNFALGAVSFLVQLLVTGRLLRTFGLTSTILLLPLALASGNLLIALVPAFWPVLVTNAFDQGLRFSVDKATYELLYLPIAPGRRLHVKQAVDIVINRVADAAGAVLLGLITGGFFVLPGLNWGVRGIAAVNLVTLSIWIALAWRLRREYVGTIRDSIRRHRIDTERDTGAAAERSAAGALGEKLAAADPAEVSYALDLIEGHRSRSWLPPLRALLAHPSPDIRRRALGILTMAGDEQIADRIPQMLRDPDIGVRTEALLYLSRAAGVDPLRQIHELGDFEDFSIRAGSAAFLAAPGPSQNLEAARMLLAGMVASAGGDGRRDRLEAARLLGRIREPGFRDLLLALLRDDDRQVAREAVQAAGGLNDPALAGPLLEALGRADLAEDAAEALARLGNAVVPRVAAALADEEVPADVRRELPAVLLRIGTVEAEQTLVSRLLESDGSVRHRIIASLNKLRVVRPDIRIDPALLELLLAAEIAGHYRSYQVLGPLRAQLHGDDPVREALRQAMEQELERIFRLMALLFPAAGLHDAYVGLRSSNPAVRANALEFLENVLPPELRHVLVPILDGQVSIDERIALADRLVGAPLQTTDQAVATLLASADPWLRASAIQAVGTLQLWGLVPELERMAESPDPLVKESVVAARAKLAGEPGGPEPPPEPAELDTGVGAG